MVCVPPFWLTPLQHLREVPSLNQDDTEPHILDKVYMCYALQEETSGIGTAHAEPTLAWPKHGHASRVHATFLHALPRAATP